MCIFISHQTVQFKVIMWKPGFHCYQYKPYTFTNTGMPLQIQCTNLLQAMIFDRSHEFDYIYKQIHENWTPLKIAFWASENVRCGMDVKR